MSKTVEVNLERLRHLMVLYGVSGQEIVKSLNLERKRKLDISDIFKENIKTSILKKIDSNFFDKGLSYYSDPNPPLRTRDTSIFFRKSEFNAKLNIDDRWRVNKIESERTHLNALIKLSGFKRISRKLRKYSYKDDPKNVAEEVQKYFNFAQSKNCEKDRDYLKLLIELLASLGVMVYEFVEAYNLKKKTSWEGMYLSPDLIVIKRQQGSFKREIFTLAHELGHYLLDIEEIDKNFYEIQRNDLWKIERWCNNFAFFFLVGSHVNEIPKQFKSDPTIKNGNISDISNKFHISRLAIYTHLQYFQHISKSKYEKLKNDLDREYSDWKQKEKLKKIEMRELGQRKSGGSQPKPIFSPLEKSIYRHAYFEGSVEEIDIIERFKPRKDQIRDGYVDNFLYE